MAQRFATGWTGPIDYQLKNDGVGHPLGGEAVVMVAEDKNKEPFTLGGVTTIFDVLLGKVRFSPVVTDLDEVHSPYSIRFKVTDAGGKDTFYPNGDPEVWIVKD